MEARLRSVLQRVFRQEVDGGNLTVAEVANWDSLTHIKLVMELEREYGITITPDEILAMYIDYSAVESVICSKVK